MVQGQTRLRQGINDLLMNCLHLHNSKRTRRRQGYTLLEVVVALTVLGIAFTGLFPLMVMQSRTVESLELQYTTQGDGNTPVFRSQLTSVVDATSRANYSGTSSTSAWYFTPSADPWARKLGAAAMLSGTKSSTQASLIANDGSACTFSGSGWTTAATSTSAYGGDYRTHALQASPTDTATWEFDNVAQGLYYVLATWPASAALDTGAKYEIYQGTTVKATVTSVNQTQTPASSVRTGWYLLSTVAFVDSGAPAATLTVQVKLYASSTGTVAADAVQLVPAAQVLSVDKSFNSEKVTVRVMLGGS
jgi:prepilin-type N-terminal cleavage/methylation domain-containing protein